MNNNEIMATSIFNNPRSWNMTNDLIFKVIFGRDTKTSKLLLADLVNTVLQLSGDNRIVEVTHLNPMNYQTFMDDKLTVLDIKAKTDNGLFLNIEMQVDRQEDYFERALYYWAQLYTEQLKEGNVYSGLEKTIGIHFIDHAMEALEEAHSIFQLMDIQTRKVVTNLIEIHFVQLPRVHDIMVSGEKDLADWVKVMKGVNDPDMQETIQDIFAQKEVMRMAAEEYKKVTADEILRHQLQSREKYIRDQHAIFVNGQKAAMKKGREQGIEQGIEEGREQGIEQGIEQGLLLVASKMLKSGKTTKEIIELTGLSLSDIKQLLA